MIKIIAFDLDNTLAAINQPIHNTEITQLQNLEQSGQYIAICSGKPMYYLCGLLRQVGLNNPIIVGENGLSIQYGINLPPKFQYKFHFNNNDQEYIQFLKKDITQKFPWVWFQPNEIALTTFFRTSEEKAILSEYFANALNHKISEFNLFEHSDSFDLTPKFDKGDALNFLMKDLNLKASEMIAVGDGENYYPMFKVANQSIGINLKNPEIVTVNVSSIQQAFDQIYEIIKLSNTQI